MISVPRRIVGALVAAVLFTIGLVGVAADHRAGATGPNVLVITAANAAFVANVVDGLTGTGRFASVTSFDGEYDTPTSSDLEGIDVVMVMADRSFDDNVALGNLLADFVDAGGRVVETVFTLYCADNSGLGGRWVTGGYGALVPSGPDCPSQIDGDGPLGFVAVDATSPLLAGVTSFNGGESSYRNDVAVATGATLVANWESPVAAGDAAKATGEVVPPLPFEAWTSAHAGCVVGLNFFPPSSAIRSDFWDSSTDGWVLQANALTFACSAIPEPPAPEPTPEVSPRFTG